MNRWRWRMARLIAPVPIIEDPGDGEVYVVIKSKTGLRLWIEADRFRLRCTSYIPALGDTMVKPGNGRFVGTVKL